MILDILNLCSSIFGLIGTLLIFKFGIPNRIDTGGTIPLVLTQIDENAIKEIAKYKFFGNIGLFLVVVNFSFQLLSSLGLNWKVLI